MTNGEMIQKILNCEVCEPIMEEDIIHVIFPDKNDSAIGFDWSWWNMEHKASTTKNDLGVDAISRTDALDSIATMCSAEELDIDFAKLLLLQRGIKALPPVTPQEPKIIPITEIKYDEDKLKELVNKAVLTVTPQEPKKGHWIWELDETPSTPISPYELNYAGWVCSCCHKLPDDVCEWDNPDEPPTYKFCPNCGTKMEINEE